MDWKNKVVLVTGGTGSFGKKFTKILLEEKQPRKIIIFSRDELKQHEMRTTGYDDPRRFQIQNHGVGSRCAFRAGHSLSVWKCGPITDETDSDGIIRHFYDKGVGLCILSWVICL